jgi:hypothetical protein
MKPKYLIYPSLLDKFQGLLSSSEIYQDYWGFSEDPEKTEEQFEQEQFQALIDGINRVPFESEAADRGTAFGEIVDCLIAHRSTDKMTLKSDKEAGTVTALYKNQTFVFPLQICLEFAEYFYGAKSQVYCEGLLPTKYGNVLLYGYIDQIKDFSIHDIKTTGKYKHGKYGRGWQHIVYPYCIEKQGGTVHYFEYNVAVLGSGMNCSSFTEYYRWMPAEMTQRLTYYTERFIEFLENNRDKITDKKIFNL